MLASKLYVENLKADIRVRKLIRLSKEIVIIKHRKGVIGQSIEKITTNLTTWY